MSSSNTRQIVEAEEFVLRDAEGRMRASLGIAEDEPGFAIFNINGKPRAIMAVPPEGPRLLLSDADGNLRAELAVGQEGPSLTIYQADGQMAVALSWGQGVAALDSAGPAERVERCFRLHWNMLAFASRCPR